MSDDVTKSSLMSDDKKEIYFHTINMYIHMCVWRTYAEELRTTKDDKRKSDKTPKMVRARGVTA